MKDIYTDLLDDSQDLIDRILALDSEEAEAVFDAFLGEWIDYDEAVEKLEGLGEYEEEL